VDLKGSQATAAVSISVNNAKGNTLASGRHTSASVTTELTAQADQSGWFELRLGGSGLVPAGSPYELTVTYTGTQELAP